MSEGPWWILPLVVVGSILIILYVSLFSLLPIPPSEKLVATGLFLNVCGAVVVLIPDLVGVDKLFEPTERIKGIKSAQRQLFIGAVVEQNNNLDGYSELADILADNAINNSFEGEPDVIIAYSGGYGVSSYVHFCYEKEDWDREDYQGDKEYPDERFNRESIGPTGVMDGRVTDYINELRSRGHQLGFALGVFLLLWGFIFQFATIIL